MYTPEVISGTHKEVFEDNLGILSHLSPLTLKVVRAPQMTLQQYLFTLPCLPLPSRNLQTPFPKIPWCYLPISSSGFLSYLLLSLSPAELSSPCQRILRCGHTIWVSVSLPWLGNRHALQLHFGESPRSSHGLCRKCSDLGILLYPVQTIPVTIRCSLLRSKVIQSEPTCLFTRSWKAIHLAAGKWLPGKSTIYFFNKF